MLRTAVVIDYQNTHLTARDVFDPSGERHESLIHPMHFARRAVQQRNMLQREGYPHAELARVLVYRGLHHVDHDWEQNRRCLDQATQWRADGAEVELRDLKYDFELDARRRPLRDINGKKVPKGRPREKGIDVLCALACVREADRDDIDLVILASRDTDLTPALDEVHDAHRRDPERYARIETVAWYDKDGYRNFGHLRPSGQRRLWNTNLDRTCYDAALDRHDYR